MQETPDIDSSSAAYAARFSGAIGAWFLAVQSKALDSLVSAVVGASVLDVGGGHAQLVQPLLARGLKLTVLGSAQSCAVLLPKDKCSFQVGDMLSLPCPEKSFDLVTCFRILPHVNAWQLLIAELCRVSRNEVIVDYPSKRSINAITPLLFKAKKKLEGNTRPYTLFTDSEIEREFLRHGFIKSGEVRQFALPMVFYRAAKSVYLANALEAGLRLFGLTRCFGSPVVARFAAKR